ncbi:MAG: class I SAM-dependent methyltransferase [Oscillospiraceae bacterium]|nr:class I SAM-dependent methyltransferase [Oscillospiraceae bacterium]
MSSYAAFADYYDALTKNVDYDRYAGYLCEILKRHHHEAGITLDLACGTGSLTLALSDRGLDVYGIDGSPDMLSVAQQKAMEQGKQLLFLCQKMQSIDLYGTVNTVFCVLDSINHLTKQQDVQKTFDRVSLFLEPDGYFVFDVNTIYKHQKVLANETFVYDTDDVYCVWQNQYQGEEQHLVQIDLDFFARDGEIYRRSSEQFWERAYSVEQLKACLQKAGLELLEIYDALHFTMPKADSQRLVFVARKP